MNPDASPQQLRQHIRDRKWTTPTSGVASGYLQANLVMLPAAEAFNFLLFCVRNPKPCPILDVLEPGQVEPIIAPGADLRTDLPRYKIFEKGEFKTEVEDVSDYFNENMVSFLLGCSFSFENAMLAAGLPDPQYGGRQKRLHVYDQQTLHPGRPFFRTPGGDHAADDTGAGRQGRSGDHPFPSHPWCTGSSGRS